MGMYTGNALLLSWQGENVSGQTKRAVAVAMQIAIGDMGAIAGTLIYRPNFDTHHYRKPHIIAIGYLAFSTVSVAYLWYWMGRSNTSRDHRLRNADQKEPDGLAELKVRQRQGDKNIYYRYII
ncbi:hypothetical protein AX15_002628 [Amanita polypyramis BW_CC]|nr:hypothetical protein AX15_002628 [Amanita polypyramis BW_CC]